MTEMQALQVTRNGPPGEVLAVRSVGRPRARTPARCWCEVGAASLNFNDIDRCLGKLVSVPTPPPYTLGMDVCGVVVEAGRGGGAVAGPAGGRHHHHRPRAGSPSTPWPTPSPCSTLPSGFDDAEATAFVLTFQASHLALFRRGRLTAGETLVVHSAASGLGTAGIQLGKAVGRPGHRRGRGPGQGSAVRRRRAPTW